MGLDLVELVLEVEDEFDIYLPDEDMECLITPDDLATYIFNKFKRDSDGKCGSQVAFYKLRKLFIENFENKREELVPNANLEELLGDNIQVKWKRLQGLLGNKIYPTSLELSKKENLILLYFSIAVGAIFYYYNKDLIATIPITVISFFALFFLLSYFIGKEVPKRYKKLSSLIKYMDNNAISNIYNTKEKVLKKVIEISSEQLGIPIGEIKPHSRYVEDLGAG
ncbi:MAG: hypothetical protein DRG30_04660 [Epsilonproteobacteria bacterium]|nr:MAG: hypothetical protein DRG30_04660 [Campylobacterota bacterium]